MEHHLLAWIFLCVDSKLCTMPKRKKGGKWAPLCLPAIGRSSWRFPLRETNQS